MDELFRSFPAILDEFEPNEQVRQALVFAAWRRAAGELLSQRSAPVDFAGKRLVVAVADEAWRRQLADLSGHLIFKLNAALGPKVVAFIEFRIDKKAISRTRAKSNEKVAECFDPLVAVNPELMKRASTIRHESLRKQFLLAANAHLSQQK
jgi:hypothetical protein